MTEGGAHERPVTFSSAGLTLAGTYRVPEAQHRMPAVLLLPGSGQTDRDDNAKRVAINAFPPLVQALADVGVATPGRLAVGTFLDGLQRPVFAAVHRDQPRGLRISLDGARYGQLLISCPDPEAEKQRLAEVEQ